MTYERIGNESEEQFLWRIGQDKDNGLADLDWQQIADIMNRLFRSDESEYRTEAAYRKPYQQAKRFFDAGVFKELNDSAYINQLRQATQELRKEKQKVSDERIHLNKMLRDEARNETDFAYLSELIKSSATQKLIPTCPPAIKSDNDLIVCVSDFHLGTENNNLFGSYNSTIAAERLGKYFNAINETKQLHNCENAYVLFLGDLINGEIHYTAQLENREMLVEQIQKASELLSEFVYQLSGIFSHVYVNDVVGNHSRPSFNTEVLRGNKLDALIPWYIKAALSHIENISFLDYDNYDATIGRVSIRGNEYWLVHGDFDKFTPEGVSKLVMMVGYKPQGIILGHMHHCSFDDVCGVNIFRSGSFSGTGDDYSITKRLYGKPSQMLVVVNDKGAKSFSPVYLD